MEITDIKMKKMDVGNLAAYAAITFDNCFVLHNIKVLRDNEELFIAMPRRKTANGSYKDIAHPINSDFRDLLRESIMEAYQKEEHQNKALS